MVTKKADKETFDSLSAVELSNFAVNQNYKANHPDISKIGFYVFHKFILPLVNFMSKFIGVSILYIYALPEEKLIEHYKTMGFSRLPVKQEKFVHNHIKPRYDEGCIFMYQNL